MTDRAAAQPAPDPVLNAELRRRCDERLANMSADRREDFWLRVERWLPDLRDGLAGAYAEEVALDLARRLLLLAAQHCSTRDPALALRDRARILRPDWFQAADMVGYSAYADRLGGDLVGVAERIPYLRELGVTYLHLLPLLTPREGDNDGGYAVADHHSVRADLGTIDDLRGLATALHGEGINLALDLVLNHVAREHPWAEAARRGDPHYRAFFHVFDDRSEPDAWEATLPEVFPDNAPGNFTWDDELQGWVWTTFNSWQWDLNWTNPDVFVEVADICLFLADLGADVIRLDAIAFIWKRLGTSCQNQPEVHAITQALRTMLRIAAPATVLKAEAIVGPRDVAAYLGQGRFHGKVSDIAYQNSLMAQIWSMLASRDVRLTVHALRRIPQPPSTSAWVTYVRCHDDIGWAVDDEDAWAVGLNGFAHRSFLSDFYSGAFPGSFGGGLVFQANEQTGDRRISGTAAALLGLSAAEQSGDPAAIDLAVRRILLVHAIAYGWGGIPVIWSGDELGMPNDPHWADDPRHAADNRWAHRPTLDPVRVAARTDPTTPAGRVFGGLAHLARVRARLPQMHASVPTELPEVHDPGVLAVVRRHAIGPMIGLYNVTEYDRSVPWWVLENEGLGDVADALTGGRPETTPGQVLMPPYTARWLIDAALVSGVR